MRKRITLTLLIAIMLVLPAAAHAQQAQQPTPAPQSQPSGIVAPELFDSATSALDAEDFDRAVLHMSLFLLLNPTFSQGYYVRALGYLRSDNTEQALVDVEQALSTAPDIPEYQSALYGLRANIHTQTDEIEDAAEDYTRAIDLNPSPELHANRALAYITLQDYEAALDDLDSAVQAVDDDPVLRLYRAFVHTRLENDLEAAQDYYEFMQLVETRRVENDPLVAGQPSIVTIERGVVHEFELEGEHDQLLTVIAQGRPGDQIDPLLVLLDDEGEVLAADDDSGGATNAVIVNFELPADGTYTVLVSHSLGGFDGQVAVAYEVTK